MNTIRGFGRRSWLRPDERRGARTGLLALLLMMTLPAAVQAQWNYTVANGTVTITGYAGPRAAVAIPDTIEGLPVTSIGNAAFAQNWNLTSVTMGDNMRNIGNDAFESCGALTSVTIGNSVTNLGLDAFYICTSLTNVTIGPSVTRIGTSAFQRCIKLASITIPDSVTSIGSYAFEHCFGLTNITLGAGLTDIEYFAFCFCTNGNLTSLTIPDNVRSIGYRAFCNCYGLTFVAIGNGATFIGGSAFAYCRSLACVTIGNGVTSIWDYAFLECRSLAGVYFSGNAPALGRSVFGGAPATVYYVPGTTGWTESFDGRPTAPGSVPALETGPETQTAEAGSWARLWGEAAGSLPLYYVWYLNETNLLSCSRNQKLELTNLQFSQSGAYHVVISNALGALTSAPALLNVVAAVERRSVPGVKVTGEPGSWLNVDYANSLRPSPNWTTLGSFSLTSTSQYCCDVTMPLPAQRFYRAWQTGMPGVVPSLVLHPVPAITLTGNLGDSWRLDYINRFGPIDAWVTLDTVTLTNTSQLYLDVSAPGQPQRLYRRVPLP